MSRRQALGVISNNYVAPSQQQQQANQLTKNQLTKQSSFSANGIKNENEPPPWCNNKQKSNDFDFEIFQEDLTDNKKSNSALLKFANKHGLIAELKSKCKENESTKKRSDKENQMIENDQLVRFSNSDDDEQEAISERYAKEDQVDEDDEEEEDDYEDDIYTSEEDEDEEYTDTNSEELEEEGISRLNIAALVDSSNESCKKVNTSSELMTMMDSSSSTQNDLSSPMVLDDTIKYHSHLSQFEENEEENECDEEKESRRKKQIIADRENQLVNCLEYKDEILTYMRKMELQNRPKSNYMKKQQDINSSMRSILVDWLVEVSEEYKLNTETLYLAANYTDRFLSQMSVLRGKLQLVGTASMYIASKYEEISPPDVSEFVYITDDTYTKKQVLRMEHLLLKVLDFRMNTPTINCFLMHYLRFMKFNSINGSLNTQCQETQSRIESLARYLAELTLIDADTFLTYLPSQIASSAIYLAMYTLNKPWTKQIADQLGYNVDLNELKSCINDMFKCMQQAAHHPQQAIQEKYKQAKYDYVSLIEPPKALPQFVYQ